MNFIEAMKHYAEGKKVRCLHWNRGLFISNRVNNILNLEHAMKETTSAWEIFLEPVPPAVDPPKGPLCKIFKSDTICDVREMAEGFFDDVAFSEEHKCTFQIFYDKKAEEWVCIAVKQ